MKMNKRYDYIDDDYDEDNEEEREKIVLNDEERATVFLSFALMIALGILAIVVVLCL